MNDGKTVSVWIACVKWFMEHPCKVWYGNPVQVWTITASGPFFIPVENIKSRVVYSKCTRDFGRILFNDTVYVIVPLMINDTCIDIHI